jgi:hypothetical protein
LVTRHHTAGAWFGWLAVFALLAGAQGTVAAIVLYATQARSRS